MFIVRVPESSEATPSPPGTATPPDALRSGNVHSKMTLRRVHQPRSERLGTLPLQGQRDRSASG
jgi:hypothetical protein